MAGALIYLSMGYPKKMGECDKDGNPVNMTSENYAYVIGLILPDLVKLDVIKSKEDFEIFFSKCNPTDIITYEEFLEYSKNPHFTGDKYNSTNPDLIKFIKTKYNGKKIDFKNPLWQGVFCHLIGDKLLHFGEDCIEYSQIKKDFEAEGLDKNKWKESKTAKLLYGEDGDYSLINYMLQKEFKVSDFLPPELAERFPIHFSELQKEPKYIDYTNLRACIYRTRLLARVVDENQQEQVAYFLKRLEENRNNRNKENMEADL